MSCVNPYKIKINGRYYNVSCGRCQNCIIKKKTQLEFLCKKEALTMYARGQGCSFVTLTYNDVNVPISKDENGKAHFTLKKKDMQNFIKNMRRQKEYYKDDTPIKIIYCGEYGSEGGRPHYHMAIMGLSTAHIAKYTKKLWKKGLCDIGTLGAGGIRYIIDYMQKSQFNTVTKLTNEALNIENPFICRSHYIGLEWILKNEKKIIENNFIQNINGKQTLLPGYIIKYIAKRNGIDYQKLINKVLKTKWNNKPNWEELELEESLIKEKWYIDAARSKGNMIQQWQKREKKWLKPKSKHDRTIAKQLAKETNEKNTFSQK